MTDLENDPQNLLTICFTICLFIGPQNFNGDSIDPCSDCCHTWCYVSRYLSDPGPVELKRLPARVAGGGLLSENACSSPRYRAQTSSKTNAPTTEIAEKAADMIKRDMAGTHRKRYQK